MIDRISRDKLALALRRYVSAKITNDELDDLGLSYQDVAVYELHRDSWYLYDDMTEHKAIGQYRVSKENRTIIARWILFLQSDREFLWIKTSPKTVLLNILSFGAYFRNDRKKGDFNVYPFYKVKDFKKESLNPRFLHGESL
ncbi:MAG: hypothetical protein U9N59_04370 [Campylobacterota bacterium]|nr:hypothetical protein [Campylobacterota bacterium]